MAVQLDRGAGVFVNGVCCAGKLERQLEGEKGCMYQRVSEKAMMARVSMSMKHEHEHEDAKTGAADDKTRRSRRMEERCAKKRDREAALRRGSLLR